MKAVIERLSEDYIKLIRMWPPGGEGRPLLLEMLRSDMLTEVREAWPRPREQEKPLDFRKDGKFADLDDEHPEDRWLQRQWEQRTGRKLEE